MMKLLLLCDPGAEQACATEARAHGLKPSESGTGLVVAEATDKKTAITAIYHLQTCLDILLLAGQGSSQDPKFVGSLEFTGEVKEIIDKTTTFAVRAQAREGILDLNERYGELFFNKMKKKVNLEKPELIIRPVIDGSTAYIGFSLIGEELRKREYRVFTSRKSLRSTLAAAALILAGYDGKKSLILPLEDDGTLAIEAALMATGTSPFKYQHEFLFLKYWPEAKEWLVDGEKEAAINAMVPSVQYLKAVQKNAKIAGVHKNVAVTKAEIDWLDTKYDEHSTDIVVGFIAGSGKHRPVKDVEKLMDDLAYQSKYVLKKTGTLTLITLKPDEIRPTAMKHGFKETKHTMVWMGEQAMNILTFKV